MYVSFSCDVHGRCALGFDEDAIPRVRANGAHTLTHQVRWTQIRPYMPCTKRWISTPFVNRSVISADRQTRQMR